MFKSLGSWFGGGHSQDGQRERREDDEETTGEEKRQEDGRQEQQERRQQQEEQQQQENDYEDLDVTGQAGVFGNYLYNVAVSATKKVSESVLETAQTLRKTVEEGKLDVILDKGILGEFNKEQEKFKQENLKKRSDVAVPPWVGCHDEDTVRQQILALSAERRNFLRDPPDGVQFHFDFDETFPVATVMLEEDELLKQMRFDLVPKLVKEDRFWRNYFYRVSLVKQSSQLTALAASPQSSSPTACEQLEMRAGESRDSAWTHDSTDSTKPRTPPLSITKQATGPEGEEEEMSMSPNPEEFASEAFSDPGGTRLCADELQKAMRELGMGKESDSAAAVTAAAATGGGGDAAQRTAGGGAGAAEPATHDDAEWEEKIQQEIQDYNIEEDEDKGSWEDEIEEMLQAEN
ncbi:synapse-associated protein 1 isoform X2 [Petromyzon marinus]|uniref:Synapse-associated protein 1 n=1 Tax=Petromyzon marinus TaxID=7757 RepID=A0AAJ7U2G2_PETMA|nr:synapse-associated protein 1 isoform X2 [Petromyzon marinus]